MTTSHQTRRVSRALLLTCALAITMTRARPLNAQAAQPDNLVILGFGQAGTWISQLYLGSAAATDNILQLSGLPVFYTGPCPGECPFATIILPGFGAATYPPTNEPIPGGDGIMTLYIAPEDGVTLPTVRARVINTSQSCQALELPVFRESALVALNPTLLAFPGAQRNAGGHSNLTLGNLLPLDGTARSSITVQIDLHTLDGMTAGATTATVDSGQTLFLLDVLAQLGAASFDGGELIVRKTSGDGYLWGFLSTVFADGRVAISTGANP
jgi:hypothetical protein